MPKRRRLNRDLVIAEAAALADAAGRVEAVTLKELAAALGIRPPSLYNHVASLDDLQAGLALFGTQQMVAELRAATLGLVGVEALRAVAVAYRRFVGAHPGIYPLLVRAPAPEETDLLALSAEIVQLLRLLLASLGIEGDEAIHAIRGLRALLHGFTSLEAAEGFKLPIDREASFTWLLETYLAGLTP